MAEREHLEILNQGVEAWNRWRAEAPEVRPDLSEADLHGRVLTGAYLHETRLDRANLAGAVLRRVLLRRADLRGATLVQADLAEADLTGADLGAANLREANLGGANLSGADFSRVSLAGANLVRTRLTGTLFVNAELKSADFRAAYLRRTVFGACDLRGTLGLEATIHGGPSEIGIQTAVRSGGEIPEAFLRGCGLPDPFIRHVLALVGDSGQYYSCFISYSTEDQAFAQRLHDDVQGRGVRCWFAPHDMCAGKKIHEQIDEAIRVFEKLLLILSPSSMKSEWVGTEIAKARRREIDQKRKMLFPVRLVGFEALRDWECFDADTGKDSAREIREYYISDFSTWQSDSAAYAREFEKLLRDLRLPDTGAASE